MWFTCAARSNASAAFQLLLSAFEEDEDVSGSVLQFLTIYYSLKYISFQFIFSPYLSLLMPGRGL
jgi:hypothetical protein